MSEMSPLIRRAASRPSPMYWVLAEQLAADIKSGQIGVDEHLPTEAALQERFKVSRHTVRQAIRELQEQGYVYTQQGVGTRVRAPRPAFRFVHGSGSMEDLLQFSKATQMRVVRERDLEADAALAERLQCAAGQQWIELSILRFAHGDALPIGFLYTYLLPEFRSIVPQIDSSSQAVFSMVENRFGIQLVEIEQDITAVGMEERMASLLSTPVSGHTLQVIRRYRDSSGRLTQVSVGYYPSGRFVHQTKVRVERGDRADPRTQDGPLARRTDFGTRN